MSIVPKQGLFKGWKARLALDPDFFLIFPPLDGLCNSGKVSFFSTGESGFLGESGFIGDSDFIGESGFLGESGFTGESGFLGESASFFGESGCFFGEGDFFGGLLAFGADAPKIS